MVKSGFVSILLGSIALPAVAFDDLEEMPESWCLTYLSTYLVTISAAASSPTKGQFPSIESSARSDASIVFNPSSLIFPEETSFATIMTTIAIESAPPSSTTNPSTESEPIVLRIVRKAPDNNRMQRRDVGGFIGTPSEICDNAEEFRLVGAQLVAGNAPIYFNGEDYKVFGAGNGEVPSGAVTRTFFRDGGILRFQNSRIVPNGEAGFCQTPSDGQVYITFSSQPAGCIPVNLSVIGVQDCQNGVESSSVIATNSEAEQIPSVSSSGPIISASSSSESITPEITTRPAAAVTTQPNGVVTTHNPIIVSNPSSTFQWSNISSSFEPPPRTSKSSLIHFSPSIFTSGSSTSVEADSSTEVIKPESSTTEGLTSTDALPASEIGTSTEETSTEVIEPESSTTEGLTSTDALPTSEIETSTEETSTADLEPTTETASIETTTTDLTTFPTTQETATTEVTTTQETTKDTTTAETIVTTTEGLTENPTSTILTSALDSTTETTTEAATTTTTESFAQIVCPSNPQQCISTFQIQCDTVIGGIPLSSGSSTLDECSQACFRDPSCVIFTHSGTQCFSTSDPSNNAGSFALQGWTSGIRGNC
ncbi:hypothetical protein FPSE_02937 [Fusarium pseudograminearum CS3096]|uniref:Apple domain-containing protein n=1 Tax=Fusarium pseudograminearum (strain CS3096) TaxID=1028729 RepID=K3UVV0_FUSPC|nr:hypothetical protein FPSE_02937 [Fusarium pseudograminearum CS3096]EKJ76751.1 hypothetical protein FPSE_02937 [Fusarium pseudograminearum CS3096]